MGIVDKIDEINGKEKENETEAAEAASGNFGEENREHRDSYPFPQFVNKIMDFGEIRSIEIEKCADPPYEQYGYMKYFYLKEEYFHKSKFGNKMILSIPRNLPVVSEIIKRFNGGQRKFTIKKEESPYNKYGVIKLLDEEIDGIISSCPISEIPDKKQFSKLPETRAVAERLITELKAFDEGTASVYKALKNQGLPSSVEYIISHKMKDSIPGYLIATTTAANVLFVSKIKLKGEVNGK